MAEPLVDVGIPTHGRPGFVTEAIESVLCQSHRGLRLVVAEDGPGDRAIAAAVAPYLEDERVRYEPAGEHLGAARTMTRIIEAGEAPYVAILHDDDRWHPGWLADRVRFLEDNPSCGMVFGQHVDIDAGGRRTGRSQSSLEQGVQGHTRFVRQMQLANLVGTPTVLVRRSAYEAAGPAFDAGYAILYDWEMMFRLALAAPAGHLLAWDSDYRTHGVQTSARSKRAREYLRLFEQMGARAAAAGPQFELPIAERKRRHARLLQSAALDEVEGGHRRDALRLVGASLRVRPAALASPTLAAALAGTAFPGAVSGLRRRLYRMRLRPDRPESRG